MNYIMFIENLKFYFFSYIKTIFYYVDEIYENYCKKPEDIDEETETECSFYTEYDIDNDMIIIQYTNCDGKKYILNTERTCDINLKDEIEILKDTSNDDFFLYCNLNGKDITSRLNKYAGPSGKHLDISPCKISYILTQEEKNTFTSLEVVDYMGNDCVYQLDDFIYTI
jgi:hypothetical protein